MGGNGELIGQARALAALAIGPVYVVSGVTSMIRRLADALESATAAPSDTDLREALAKWLFEFRNPDSASYWDAGHVPEFAKDQYRTRADAILPLFSRTPQPSTTDAQVEAGAKVLYADYTSEYDYAPWELGDKTPFLNQARAVLEAAAAVTPDTEGTR